MADWKEEYGDLPLLRREPYLFFFPLGGLLLWAGILHWLLFALGWTPRYRPLFHSSAQVQGFLSAFACGFLFTALPRRTSSPPPATFLVLLGLAAPPLATVLSALGFQDAGLAVWSALALCLLGFSLRRLRPPFARRRAPDCFVWIPASLGAGLAGAAILGFAPSFLEGAEGLLVANPWVHLGRGLLLEGMFFGLVLGLGGMVLPLLMRGAPVPDMSPATWGRRGLHLACILLLVASFFLQHGLLLGSSEAEPKLLRSVAFGLRGALALFLLLWSAELFRLPEKPGLHRRFLWFGTWMIPVGYFLAASLGDRFQAGLHLVFLLGFALPALSIGLHVTLAHGPRSELVGKPSLLTVLFGLFFFSAALGRILLALDPSRGPFWLGLSSALLLLSTLPWFGRLLQGFPRRPLPQGRGKN